MQTKPVSLLICLLVAAVAFAEETELQRHHRLFSEAEQLRQAKELEKAFLVFAKIPGGQHAAIRIGRQSPQEYIDLLETHADEISAPLALSIEADLLLALGKTEEASQCVGKVAKCTTDGEEGWQQGKIPADTYLVDLPQRNVHGYHHRSLLQPLVIGPGSHRHNWLIRRCVALKRWDEAAAEYARVWKIHREHTKPYIANVPTSHVDGETIYEKKLVTPAGFDGRGLQFALDFAFFLKRQGDLEQSLVVLREPLFAIDMDRNPNHQQMSAATQQDLETYPLKNIDVFARYHWSWGRSAGVSRKEFLRLAYGAFKDAGEDEALVAALTKKIEAGDNRLRRVLARLRFHQNDIDAALALEDAYVRHAEFNDLTVAYRLGRAYEDAGKNEKAIEQYEKAAELPDESVSLPDAEEVTRNSYMQQARAIPAQFMGPRTSTSIKADIASRLQRLYGATAKPEKSYEAMLRQFDANPSLFGDLNQLEQAKTRAEVVDAAKGFDDWLAEKTGDKQLAVHLPTMYWALKRYDDRHRVRTNFTRNDGLCGNRIPTGVATDGRVYFGSGWGDNGGGLIVADPKTRVFSAYYQTDGLGTDKIAWLEKDGDALKVTYDVEYGRGNNSYNYRIFQPNRYDPIAGRPLSTAVPTSLDQRSAHAAIARRERDDRIATPYLGGFTIREQTVGDAKYICGTRGLVIVDADAEIKPPRIEELTPQVTADPHVMLKALANQGSLRVNSPADFVRLAADENPYIRARALSFVAHLVRKTPQPYLPPLRKLLADELPGNRLLATKLLGEVGDGQDVKPIEKLLTDPDRRIREAATIALVRLGEEPNLAAIAKLLERRRDSSDQYEILGALAKHPKPEVFELLLKHPLHSDEYEPRDKIYETIRQSLLKNPKLADVLLLAYNEDGDPGPESNYGSTRFAQEVFKRTGVEMLPILREALESENRVIRSNAARACGAIKDPSSKEPLLAALDLESGLSRGSIVWALGELRAKEILPRLAEFYVDARNDERRGQQAGYRYAQSESQMQSQFESISRLDAIATDYDELTHIAAPEPIRPKANEPLLTPKIILAAVAKIGPESSQEFYRALAGEDDTEARREAATRLAECGEADCEQNVTILGNLWADADIMIRMTAGVSLLILGETYPEKQILIWLSSGEPYPQSQLIVQLERIEDSKKLAFARDALIRYAAKQKSNRYFRERIMNLANRARGGE